MSVIKYLCDNLESLGYEVFLQGTYSGDDYPDNFITYICNDSPDGDHYDDEPQNWIWNFTVIFYSRNPYLLETAPDAIRARLKAAGFIPQGKGLNVFSDDPNVSGWSTDYLFKEQN